MIGLVLLLVLTSASDHAPLAAAAIAPSLWNPGRAVALRDGDLVFRTGPSFTSNLVMAQRRGSRFSHVGLALWIDGQLQVLHAAPAEAGRDGGGVVLQPMSKFSDPEHAVDLAVFRPTALDEEGRRMLRTYALAQLGKPFDDDFLVSEDSRMYCTELAMKALRAAGIDAVNAVPRIQIPLHQEAIPVPDDLRRWRGLTLLPVVPLS